MTLAGKRVLIVEDEALVAMLVEEYLEEFGCEIAGMASRLDEAVQKAITLAIDVAVLDVNLAGKLSYPIAEVLMSRNIPFIFATGYGNTALPAALVAAPVLPKPFERGRLAEALHAAITAKSREQG